MAKVLLSHYERLNSSKTEYSKAIILAAEAGSVKMTQMLLDGGAEVDWEDEEGSTTLHWAVAEGHEGAVATLLNNGADINSRDNYGNTPLHWAIPHMTIPRLLLEKGADANVGNNTKQAPLHWGAQVGQESVVKILLDHGASVESPDSFGITVLHAAALQGHAGYATLLLKHGASRDSKDTDGWAPLYAVAMKEHDTFASELASKVEDGSLILEEVRSAMRNKNDRARMEDSVENKSCGSTVVSGLRSAVNSGYKGRVLVLLENGVDIDAVDHIGGSAALTLAAWLGRDNIVQLLLDNGADANQRERNGRTTLHITAEDSYPDIVVILVDGGADADVKVHGWTPLLLAAKAWHCWIVDHLVENGADVNAEDYDGRRALHWAAKHGGATLATFLLENRAEVDAKDHCGVTALELAVENKRHSVVELLQRGMSPSPRAIARDSESPLSLI